MTRHQLFSAELIAAIERHYPGACHGDQAQIEECSAALAIALGGMLAYAAMFSGEGFVDEWEELVLAIIRKEAAEILAKARGEAALSRH